MSDQYAVPVSQAQESVRAAFIRNTYIHLAFAIMAFAVLEFILLNSPLAPAMAKMMTTGRFTWLFVIGAFMVVSYVADRWAMSAESTGKQYAGLALYVVAESIIFVPLLYFAAAVYPGVITMAALFTLLIFGGLTFTAFTCGKDFSFLRGFLTIGFVTALGLIVASLLFGFALPTMLFSGVMILLASGAILYSTSNVLRHYHTNQHVAASLSLFASVALLFWYMIQFLMSLSGD